MKTMVLLSIVIFSFNACTFNSYKIIDVKNELSSRDAAVEFLLPPLTQIGIRHNPLSTNVITYTKGSKFRYQYIIFQNLSTNYSTCLENVELPDYLTKQDPALTLLNKKYNITGHANNVGAGNLAKYYSSSNNIDYKTGDKITLAIELDLNQLLNSESEYVSNYNQLSTDLFMTFIKEMEETKLLPSSITQNIVEKIWELTPIPQEASLARFGYIKNDGFSLLPLNPKIVLRIDHMTTYDSRQSPDVTTVDNYLRNQLLDLDTKDTSLGRDSRYVTINLDREALNKALALNVWRYEYTGQTYIEFTKNQRTDGAVLFKFDPFVSQEFPRSTNLPTNIYKNIDGVKLLSSSIDPDFTTDIGMSKYILLYQKSIKGTNSTSTIGSAAIDRCCRQDLGLTCNSLLLYRDDLRLLSTPMANCVALKPFAIFGDRSMIVPCIYVQIKSSLKARPFNSTLGDCVQNGIVPKNVSVKRIHRGAMKVFKTCKNNLYLLPGDIIDLK